MMDDDLALLESLLAEMVDALMPVQGAFRSAEIALEVVRKRRAERTSRFDVILPDLLDESRFTVRWKGAECHLGSTVSFRLLSRLARPANHYVSVGRLLEDVWGDDRIDDSTVRSTVRHLRRKLEAAGMVELAEAIRGQPGHYGLMLPDASR